MIAVSRGVLMTPGLVSKAIAGMSVMNHVIVVGVAVLMTPGLLSRPTWPFALLLVVVPGLSLLSFPTCFSPQALVPNVTACYEIAAILRSLARLRVSCPSLR